MERYYSVNLFHWPIVFMFKWAWRHNPIVVILLWPLLLLMRFPGLRPKVTFGIRYPDELPIVDLDSIPREARVPLDKRIEECTDLGFGDAMTYSLEALGEYEHYEVVMIHETGIYAMQIRWYRLTSNGVTEQDCEVYCSSALKQGGGLSSAALSKSSDVPEFVLKDVQRRVYPETTTIAELFEYHRQSIPATAVLREFDKRTYADYLLQRSQQLVDQLLAEGFYLELSPKQIERLKQRDSKASDRG